MVDGFIAKPTVQDLGMLSAKPAQANFMNNYAYWISAIRYDPSDPPGFVIIEGDGSVMGTKGHAQVAVRVEFDVAGYLFTNGIFAEENIAIGGTGDMDSYNSCDGPYDPDNPGSNATVGTNATGPDSIALHPQAVIHGEASIGPGGNPDDDITGGDVTGGTYAMQDPMTLYPISDPGGGTSLTLGVDLSTGDINTTVNSGTFRLSDLTLNGKDTITINGAVTLIVDGPLTIGGKAQIIINKGASLKVYANDNIDLGGNSIVNLSNQPKNNLLFGTSTVTDIFIHGTSQFYGAVYAPTAAIRGVGTADFFGAMTGKTISTTGTFGVHQDECLGNGTGGGDQNLFKVAFWRGGGYQ